jgi:hypothetical protein
MPDVVGLGGNGVWLITRGARLHHVLERREGAIPAKSRIAGQPVGIQ